MAKLTVSEIPVAIAEFHNLTLDERKTLMHREEFYDTSFARWRVSGKPKTWKRTPGRVIVPAKFGLYDSYHFSQSDYMLYGPYKTASALRVFVMHYKDGWKIVRDEIMRQFPYAVPLTTVS